MVSWQLSCWGRLPEPGPGARGGHRTCSADGMELENLEETAKLKWCVARRARRSAF